MCWTTGVTSRLYIEDWTPDARFSGVRTVGKSARQHRSGWRRLPGLSLRRTSRELVFSPSPVTPVSQLIRDPMLPATQRWEIQNHRRLGGKESRAGWCLGILLRVLLAERTARALSTE